jgi:hypothetical protein
MDWIKGLTDEQLRGIIVRLEREIRNFDGRLRRRQAAMERIGSFSSSAPLYQRLASIRKRLEMQLRQAEKEAARRARTRAKGATCSLRAAIAGWFARSGRSAIPQ